MTKLLLLTKLLFLLLVFVTSALRVDAQSPKRDTAPRDLVRTITSLDSALFDSYNRCDLAKFASFWSNDAEFYHDQGGLTIGTQNITNAVRKNICGKVRRELVPGTLEVYIMHGYGAVEVGVHRFHHPARDDVEPVGESKFVHLWQEKDGNWRITRVISYDHHPLAR